MKKLLLLTLFLISYLCFSTPLVAAADPVQFLPQEIMVEEQDLEQFPKEENLQAKVVEIVDSGEVEFMGEMKPFQKLRIEIISGSQQGRLVEVDNGGSIGAVYVTQLEEFKVGDKIKLYYSKDYQGEDVFMIAGHSKKDTLFGLFLIFAVVVVLVGRWWGVLSLVGLGLSFGIIFGLILPLITRGYNPVLVSLLGSLLLIPMTFYVTHGFNKKTHVGVASTVIALALTAILASWFVEATHLTGFASDESSYLQYERKGSIDIKGLLLAGIIIGTLGVLDDVTVGQASTVKQLVKVNPKLKTMELYNLAMSVGQDHISSMVNTLVLVYSGAALPMLLLFMGDNRHFFDAIEYEVIAEEIVRMMVGSIGLVVVAPLATYIAAVVFSKKK